VDEDEVQRIARAFVASVDATNIRHDLSPYVTAADAKVVEEELGEGESGYTITAPNGTHVITINSLESPERQRFTVCHEIAHIILKLPSSHSDVPSWSYAKRHPNEIACDTFAAELLMPYAQWLALVPREEPSAALIQNMADQFGASFPAAGSRFASLSKTPAAFVTMDRGMIRHAARSASLRRINAWISPRSPIPPGSLAFRLRSVGVSAVQTEDVAQDVWFDDWPKGTDLREMARHYAKSDTTVSLLWFDEDELPEVEVTRFGVRMRDDDGLPELTGELPWPGKRRRR
jgi:Zn-dependent peptidase ImmA (M78 family)